MRTRMWAGVLLAVAGLGGGPVGAADRGERSDLDVKALYERLSPGMSVREVAALTGGQLGAAADPVTAWLLWSQAPGGGTAVLRAAFQDGRVSRLEYEWFGSEYRRLVKGGDPWVEIPGDELARVWRQAWQAGRLAEGCRGALDAYHRVVLGAQERLTGDEQQEWARALQLRRAVEQQFAPAGR
jgi:hypothetical protein